MDTPFSRQPDVRVSSTADGDRFWLRLTAVRAGAERTVALKPPEVVRNRCARLGAELAAVAETFRRTRIVPTDQAARLLNQIATIGRGFLADVLRNPNKDYGALSVFLREGCPSWPNGRVAPPLIQTVSETKGYFPWELLPLFRPDAVIRARTQLELEEASLAFPGFAAIVERRDRDRPDEPPFLDGWGRLPVRVVYDAGYPGALEEVAFFSGNDDVFRLEGPYPRDVDDTAAPTLGQQLCDPALGVDGERTEYSDQILHFACDCEATPGVDPVFAYHLRDEHGRPMGVSLKEVTEDQMLHWGARAMRPTDEPEPDMPLVFLNACGTAVMDPASALSLLEPFHRNQNRGIIGTAANVPDRTAAELSRWFYTSLVHGADVGRALHEAKWRLLQDRGNPLGLLYAIHAFAGQRVLPLPTRRPIPLGGST